MASAEGQTTTMLASQQDPALSYMEKLGLLKAKFRPGISEVQEAATEAALKQNVTERAAIAGLRAEREVAAAQAAKEATQEAIERAGAFRRTTQAVDLSDPASAPVPTGRTSVSQLPNVGVAVQAVTKAAPKTTPIETTAAFSQQAPTASSGQQVAGAAEPIDVTARTPFGGGVATDAVAQPKTETWIPHLDKRKTSLEPDAMRAKMVV